MYLQDVRVSSPASSFSFCSTSANDDWLCGCEPEGSSFLLFAAGPEVRSPVIVLCPGTQRGPYFPNKSHTLRSCQRNILLEGRRGRVDVHWFASSDRRGRDEERVGSSRDAARLWLTDGTWSARDSRPTVQSLIANVATGFSFSRFYHHHIVQDGPQDIC